MEKNQDYTLPHTALGTAIAFPIGLLIALYTGSIFTLGILVLICGVVALITGTLSITRAIEFKNRRYFLFGIFSLLIILSIFILLGYWANNLSLSIS